MTMPVSTTEARTALSRTLERFREHGAGAEPLVFGDHRRAEGVVLPYAVFVQLQDHIDQLRLEAATEVISRIERVIAEPDTAVTATRRRRR
jgi:hypothetical protein